MISFPLVLTPNALIIMTEVNKDKLMRMLERNEYDWWYAPSIGFIQDFGKIYWELHNLILEELGETPYETPIREREYWEWEQKQRKIKTDEHPRRRIKGPKDGRTRVKTDERV